MALSNTRLGSAIAATIQSFRPADGTAISISALEQMWQEIAQDIIDEFKNHADINLAAGDIEVPALGLFDSTSQPVTGQAVNAPKILTGKIE